MKSYVKLRTIDGRPLLIATEAIHMIEEVDRIANVTYSFSGELNQTLRVQGTIDEIAAKMTYWPQVYQTCEPSKRWWQI